MGKKVVSRQQAAKISLPACNGSGNCRLRLDYRGTG